ncbi:uncharacterized protein LOC102718892 [Oryza brachyantha]|uniref:Uncharacterized protein n=1 Tax=Oryza brachyantha TaxID=4533 RepID=J3L6R5_ORYBR|nr:uncharacterized protein LOC102718892 [Oryza brachyantha]
MTLLVPPSRARVMRARRQLDDAAEAALLEDLLIRRMEEGLTAAAAGDGGDGGDAHPPSTCFCDEICDCDVSQRALRYFLRGLMTTVSVVMIAGLLYLRHTTDDPDVHDPGKLAMLIILFLGLMVFGFCFTTENAMQRLPD